MCQGPYERMWHCEVCGTVLDRPGTLCLECAMELRVADEPMSEDRATVPTKEE